MADPIPSEGDFSWSVDKDMFEDAYMAITEAAAWELMKYSPGENGYMYTTNANYKEIKIKYAGHSGTSYGLTMRAMQFLAKNGWAAFYERFRPKD